MCIRDRFPGRQQHQRQLWFDKTSAFDGVGKGTGRGCGPGIGRRCRQNDGGRRKGRLVDGDKVMAICALDMKERGLLKKDVLVGTVMSNLGLELGMKEHGIKLVKTDVGDRYVLEEMLKSGYNLGGEQSGHIIFLDHNTTGDGILTGIQLLGVMKRRDERLGRLAKVVTCLLYTSRCV